MEEQQMGCCHHHPAKIILAIVMAIVGIALVVFLASLTRNSMRTYDYIGKTPDNKDRITISGEGKVTAKPDVALVSIGVISESVTVAQAQKDNTDKMNSIISALKSQFSIADKDIQTSNYSINPKYDWSTHVQRIVGYSVSQNVNVKVRNFEKIGDIIARAGELGSNNVNGPSFTIDDPEVYRAQAREKAIAQAKEKADTLANQVGIKLGRIVNFSEGSAGGYYPVPMMDTLSSGEMMAKSVAAPTIESGSQDVQVSVSVSYEIK